MAPPEAPVRTTPGPQNDSMLLPTITVFGAPSTRTAAPPVPLTRFVVSTVPVEPPSTVKAVPFTLTLVSLREKTTWLEALVTWAPPVIRVTPVNDTSRAPSTVSGFPSGVKTTRFSNLRCSPLTTKLLIGWPDSPMWAMPPEYRAGPRKVIGASAVPEPATVRSPSS